MIAGIDYGSKMAGTTVICLEKEDKMYFIQSKKKLDADKLLLNVLVEQGFKGSVYIDAPLSLPRVYNSKNSSGDFFYRKCDKETGAMSPMFLGGLTARAMRISFHLQQKQIKCYEAYPGGLAKNLRLNDLGYKKDPKQLAILTNKIAEKFKLNLEVKPSNWHQFDSLLCYCIGLRHRSNQATSFGDSEEGIIWI